SLLVPAATMSDPRALGEGRHVAFSLSAGGSRSRCVAFGSGAALPVEAGVPADAAVRLASDRYNGSSSPQLIRRDARHGSRGAIEVPWEPATFAAGADGELARDLAAWAGATAASGDIARLASPPAPDVAAPDDAAPARAVRDLRGTGIAGL